MNIEYWVHRYPYIMKSGRMEHFIPKHRNEEEQEELKGQLEEADPVVDRMRRLNEDVEGLWNLKFYGDGDIYSEEKGEDKKDY